MKLLMCAIYDKVTGAHLQPYFSRSKGEAIRLFSDACQDKESPYHRHPEDFVLFLLAEYHDDTGAVTPLVVTEKLVTALDCVRQE